MDIKTDLSNIKFNKRYGQNFITDTNLLKAIVADSGVGIQDTVLEIGAGAGTLTKQLAIKAKNVIAYEIDSELKDILSDSLKAFTNIELRFEDFLKRRDKQEGKYKVVANLPYYITTPIIFDLLENSVLPETITLMVQKEVGERLTAHSGTAEYGAITAAVSFFGDAKITRVVKREMFTPRPNVDSCVVRIDIREKFPYSDYTKYSKVVKAAFLMRRKTLANNLTSSYQLPKPQIENILNECGIPAAARGETLGAETFYKLALTLDKYINSGKIKE